MVSPLIGPFPGPPQADEIEISVFGRGIGECVVVHLGSNHWVIIDSFCSESTGEPAALNYLRDYLGLDPGQAVRSVVISHLHTDHYAGIHALYEACGAETWLYFPDGPVEWDERFVAGVEKFAKANRCDDRYMGLTEVCAAWSTAAARNRRATASGPNGGIFTGGVGNLRVIGPSPRTVNAMKNSAAQLADPNATETPATLMVGPGANFTSLVIWLKVGEVRALLGGDMDCHPARGWEALVNDLGTEVLGSPSLVKVPHHGSRNDAFVDLKAPWMTGKPVSILAPYRGGKSKLPDDAMLNALISSSGSVFSTNLKAPDELDQYAYKTTSATDVVIARTSLSGHEPWSVHAITDAFSERAEYHPDAKALRLFAVP